MSKSAENEIMSLEDIWVQQAALNKQAGFDTREMGRALAVEEQAARLPESGGTRVSVGVAIKNYLDALSAECMELQDCLSWKHWYKEAKEGRQYELRDNSERSRGGDRYAFLLGQHLPVARLGTRGYLPTLRQETGHKLTTSAGGAIPS